MRSPMPRRTAIAARRKEAEPNGAPFTAELDPKEMGAGIAASPHCAERRICRCS